MRCYHFCNFYLAGIHAGIQAAHAQHELAIKYVGDGHNPEMFDSEFPHVQAAFSYVDWAKNHKTMILLNAGMMGDLVKLESFLSTCNDRYPHASFREDQYALNGALTNVCIVLPYEMYELNHHINQFHKEPWPGFYEFSHEGFKRTLVRLENGDIELRANTDVLYTYNEFDLRLIQTMSSMRLM